MKLNFHERGVKDKWWKSKTTEKDDRRKDVGDVASFADIS